jgi:beta-glucanase (GH16 family)
MRLLWEDNFEGTELNTSRWNVLEQLHRGGVYTRDNVVVANGVLSMRTIAQNITLPQGEFYVSSGAVNTSGLFEMRTGRWEASVKLPKVSESAGYTLHSSIWLFDTGTNPNRTGCAQEIDVVEQYSIGTPFGSRAAANLHPFNGSLPSRGGTGCTHIPVDMPVGGTAAIGDWTSNWTTFTVDWADDWIAMRVNGKLYAHFETDKTWYTDPLFLALTACVMDRVPPNQDDTFPLYYLVDWVRVYAFA